MPNVWWKLSELLNGIHWNLSMFPSSEGILKTAKIWRSYSYWFRWSKYLMGRRVFNHLSHHCKTHIDNRWSISSVAGSSGELAVMCQVLQTEVIQRVVNQNGQLIFNTLLHWQPMKLHQDGHVRNAKQQWVTAVKVQNLCISSCLN